VFGGENRYKTQKEISLRPTVAEVDLSAIVHNIKAIKNKVAPAQVMAVVKANAYGHGVAQVSQVALENGASYLGVALVEEGIELREKGFRAPILVFGGLLPEQVEEFVRHNLDATVYDERTMMALQKAARQQNKQALIHVKIDTGMGRVGIPWEQAEAFIQKATALENIKLQGIYTHFATSDEMDKSFAYLQLARFKDVVRACERDGLHIPIKHTANSGAILDVPEAYFNMVRPGVMMYGYYPSKETTESVAIKPAMTFRTRILHIKEIERGTSVSYGRTFIARQKTRVATLPVGYADGYNRLLSNQGEVLIRGKRFPVIGRVCMDLIMVDLGQDQDIRVGDEVVLFGSQNGEEVSVQSICDKLNTIPYEVTCWVSERVPRVYKQ